jgi:hypothetical protein
VTENDPGPRLDELTLEDFSPAVGDTFRMRGSEAGQAEEVELELAEATSLGSRAGQPGRPETFSLLFRGPAELRAPQGIYRLEHERLGAMDVFLVPLGPDETGTRYEAVFN